MKNVMKSVLRVLGASAFASLLLGMLAVYLTPLDVYVPDMEQELSVRLHTDVNIGSVRAALFPWPHLELRDTLLGGRSGIAVRSADLTPDMGELLHGRVTVYLKLHDGAAHFSQIQSLLAGLPSIPAEKGRARLGEIWLSGIVVLVPGAAIGPLEGKLEFAETGALRRAWFGMESQRVTTVLEPVQNAGLAITMQAKEWQPSWLPGYFLNEFQLEGMITGNGMVAKRISATSQGIHVSGSGWLDVSNGVSLRAVMDHFEIPLDRLMAILGRAATLHGVLSGNGRLEVKGRAWKGLWSQARFDGEVRADGVQARIAESFATPLSVEHVRSHVRYDPDNIALNGLTAELYGGSLEGTIEIQRKLRLNAKLSINDINVGPMVKAFANEMVFYGKLRGESMLQMNLDRLDRFPQNLQQEGKFVMQDGALSKVDLEQAAKGASKGGGASGVTRFDSLAFGLQVGAFGYRFRDIKISSGSLNAEGKLDISPTRQLNGMLDVSLKRTAGLVSTPLTVSGSLSQPKVAVSGATWAGAAVGTAILGPGLGTALGARVGGFLNKLFGGGKGGFPEREQSNSVKRQ